MHPRTSRDLPGTSDTQQVTCSPTSPNSLHYIHSTEGQGPRTLRDDYELTWCLVEGVTPSSGSKTGLFGRSSLVKTILWT